MMKTNKLGFLALLSLLGILGLTTDNRGFLGFFGFAVYFRYFFVTPDEMFQENVRRAASVGFFSGIAAAGLALAACTLFPTVLTSNAALASCYIVSVFVFTLMLVFLELKEQRGC